MARATGKVRRPRPTFYHFATPPSPVVTGKPQVDETPSFCSNTSWFIDWSLSLLRGCLSILQIGLCVHVWAHCFNEWNTCQFADICYLPRLIDRKFKIGLCVCVHAIGIGFGQLIVLSLVSIYYNMIIAWALFYLFESFIHITNLPWAHCFNEWNTCCQFVHCCCLFTARSSYASAVLGIVILSVRLSVRHTRVSWRNERTYNWNFNTAWKGNQSSFLMPK